MSLDISAINSADQQRRINHIYSKYHLPQLLSEIKSDKREYNYWRTLYMPQSYKKSSSEIKISDDEILSNFVDNWTAPDDQCTELESEWRKWAVKQFNAKPYHNFGLNLSPGQNIHNRLSDELEDAKSGIKSEVANYHIGYASFSFLRELLAKYVGAKYFYSEYYTREDGIFLNGKPKPESYTLSYPNWWNAGRPVGKALLNLFLHSDSDGTISSVDVHLLANYFWQHKVRSRMSVALNDNSSSRTVVKSEYLYFLDFLQIAAAHDCYLDFH